MAFGEELCHKYSIVVLQNRGYRDGLALLYVEKEAGTLTCEIVHGVKGKGAMGMRRVEGGGKPKLE